MADDGSAALLRALLGFWWPAIAPTALTQPVLPDWNFGTILNVNSDNSAAPDAEAAILRTQSYGRQLGQISDALQVLVDERNGGRPGPDAEKALEKFRAMKRENDDIKAKILEARVQRLRDDLKTLSRQDPVAYRRLLDDLPEGI